MPITWFITGASRGFGRAWATGALERGDRVACAVRDPSSVADLVERHGDAVVALRLDVTDRAAAFAAVAEAHARLGGLDVVVNNAGFGHFGAVEELAEAEVRAQLETNVLGALWVTQAAIPLLRERGPGGRILQVSSVGGVLAFPGLGAYHASKWAVEGLSDALAQELAPQGIHVTIVEPGGYATDWGDASAGRSTPLPRYEPLRDEMLAYARRAVSRPAEATTSTVLDLVDHPDPPRRLVLSSTGHALVVDAHEARLREYRAWGGLSGTADTA